MVQALGSSNYAKPSSSNIHDPSKRADKELVLDQDLADIGYRRMTNGTPLTRSVAHSLRPKKNPRHRAMSSESLKPNQGTLAKFGLDAGRC